MVHHEPPAQSGLRRAFGRRARRIPVLVIVVVALGAALSATQPTVWIENRSSAQAVVFVSDNSDSPAAWYVVPAGATVHAGSAGLGTTAVRVNLLGWRHEANGVSPCSPGDYDDTIYDVPRAASVRLLIDETGRPSVSLATEPVGLRELAQVPLGDLSEAERCAATGSS
jgi:hypothetical protein